MRRLASWQAYIAVPSHLYYIWMHASKINGSCAKHLRHRQTNFEVSRSLHVKLVADITARATVSRTACVDTWSKLLATVLKLTNLGTLRYQSPVQTFYGCAEILRDNQICAISLSLTLSSVFLAFKGRALGYLRELPLSRSLPASDTTMGICTSFHYSLQYQV